MMENTALMGHTGFLDDRRITIEEGHSRDWIIALMDYFLFVPNIVSVPPL